MSEIETPKRPRYQFRLRTLLAWTFLWAVFLSLIQLFGLWLAILLATYLLAIAAIRTEFGYEQGSVIAAVGTTIVVFSMALVFVPEFLIVALLAVPLGLILGYVCFLLIHTLALVGAWDVFDIKQKGAGSRRDAGAQREDRNRK